MVKFTEDTMVQPKDSEVGDIVFTGTLLNVTPIHVYPHLFTSPTLQTHYSPILQLYCPVEFLIRITCLWPWSAIAFVVVWKIWRWVYGQNPILVWNKTVHWRPTWLASYEFNWPFALSGYCWWPPSSRWGLAHQKCHQYVFEITCLIIALLYSDFVHLPLLRNVLLNYRITSCLCCNFSATYDLWPMVYNNWY